MNTIAGSTNTDLDKSVLVLSLKKQHYLDKYQEPMTGTYSCFGYYDAIDIHFPQKTSSLFQKKSNIQISPIWYGMGELIESQTGRFSQQNIGLFSIIDKDSPDAGCFSLFWGEHSNSPYFAVGFIRLKDIRSYKKVATEIMQFSINNNGRYVTVVVYYTYDNTDLVVLLRGNSISEISKVMLKIERNHSVYYMHSILGISEDYLKECKRKENGIISVPPAWNDIDCHINEYISEVEMRISVSGGLFNPAMVRGFFEKHTNDLQGLEDATIAYMHGHESVCIRIPRTNVKGVISLISEQGFCTHENSLYGNGILNIETSIIINESKIQKLASIDPPEISSQTDLSTPWTSSLMLKYSDLMKFAWDNKNESLYSCFLGMHQTLNTLSQYEGFSMSKDIFYMLFPGFDMFDKHLAKELSELYPQSSADSSKTSVSFEDLNDALMEKISRFTMSVNQIIYHTIHTDQVFLMVPGYAGASYSIPIRLCMFYLHLSDLIINTLNDSKFIKSDPRNKYEYNVLFVPEMEERPKSALLYFDHDDQNSLDRTIVFNVSQRALYLPRHFIIILTHELAHYVGVFIRERGIRRTCVIKMISDTITDDLLLLNEDEPQKSQHSDIFKEILLLFYKYYKQTIRDQCRQFLYHNQYDNKHSVKAPKADTDEKWLHAASLESELAKNCNEFLINNRGLRQIITDIPELLVNELHSLYQKNNDYSYTEFMILVGECQSLILRKGEDLLASDSIYKWLNSSIFPLFKEIFSDTAARCLLDCDEQTYLEAFNISEGHVRDAVIHTASSTNGETAFSQSPLDFYRHYIINSTFSDSGPNNPKDQGAPEGQPTDPLMPSIWEPTMPDYWEENLKSYARACKDSINQHLESDPEAKRSVTKLREIFTLFLNTKQSKSEIYNNIVRSIYSFQIKTEREYMGRCSNLKDDVGEEHPV